MAVVYSIRDWDKDFENHESRKLVKTRWVPVPNKHDGKTFNRIASHPRAVEIFCGWSLIIEVASKMPVRGILADEDGPLTAEDLADKTRFPVAIFEIAMEVLTQPRFGWMDRIENGQQSVLPPSALPGVAGVPPPGGGGPPPGARPKRHEPASDAPDLPFHSPEFLAEWADYLQLRKEKRSKLTPIAQRRLFKQFLQWGEDQTIAALRWSIPKGWTGVFQPRIPGAGVQAPMFKAAEPEESRKIRESCKRCHGTNTEVVPGKGARPCDHLPSEEIE